MSTEVPQSVDTHIDPARAADIAVVSGKVRPVKTPDPKTATEDAQAHDAKRNEKNLEKGLQQTMDASDPVSTLQP